MFLARQVTAFRLVRWIAYCALVAASITSCTIPKKFQQGKPFVYKTNINIVGNVPDKLALQERLQNQLDDSLKTRIISYAGVRRVLLKPPVFDTINIGRSRIFMTSLLRSLGYFYPQIRDTFYIDTVRKQYRAHVRFTVTPGKVLRLDSIGYAFRDPELQRLALRREDRSTLKKTEPYTLQKVSDELDRLLTVFRNNGYYKLNKEDIFAEVDTVVAALIDPTLDPFEQISLLDSLRKKRENPTINVVFKQHPVKDSSRIKKYYIGTVTVFPDASYQEEFDHNLHDTATLKGYTFIYNSRRFKLPFIANNITIRPGSLYVQRRYYRTINNFTSLGAWSNVDVEMIERYDSSRPTLDAKLRLYPALKQNMNLSLETSRNVSDFLTTGQLFGIGLNYRLLNRNAYREAIQTVTNARFGIELGSNFIQTLQASLAHTISFPRFITPFFKVKTDSLINPRTLLNLNTAYTDRLLLFQSRSFNASWGYEWVKGRRREDLELVGQRWRKTWQWIPLNYEYTDVLKQDSLKKLEEKISSYRYAFNNGLIMSQILSMSTGIEKDNKLTLLRARVESSGALAGFIKKLELGSLARFIKIDGEWKHNINYPNSKASWAFRAFAGYGFVYGKTKDTFGNIVDENNLPFFKAYFAGGPYSMRAWQIRRLGPGSSNVYQKGDTSAERFGNMQIELNTEFRFNITTIAGIKVNSALFVDMGNIWSTEFYPNTTTKVPEASFKLSRLYKDLAIGAGSSLRFDFDFFLIRLDWAYKIKDPLYANKNDGWFNDIRILNGQFQLGIGYPF
jgi:outer membrane protein insertion porin family